MKEITVSRERKSWRITTRDKELLALQREAMELRIMINNAPLEKLDQPYQKGWERYFTLTEEALRRKDAPRLKELLPFIQNRQFSKNASFYRVMAKKSKRKVPRKHKLKSFTPVEILKAQIPEELLRYFIVQKRRPVTPSHLLVLLRSGFRGRISLRYPHYFKRKSEPYMITHRKVALPEIESRLHEVEALIYSPQIRGRLNRIQGHSTSWHWDYLYQKREALKLTRLHQKEVNQAIHDFNETKGDSLPLYLIIHRQGGFLCDNSELNQIRTPR